MGLERLRLISLIGGDWLKANDMSYDIYGAFTVYGPWVYGPSMDELFRRAFRGSLSAISPMQVFPRRIGKECLILASELPQSYHFLVKVQV